LTHDYLKARERMVRDQLLTRSITDQRVIDAMRAVPRHIFVEDALHAQAYGDFPLPIGEGQTISQPFIVALMIQMLGLQGHERVLEIGTGCGYQAAVLSMLADQVYSVERIKKLLARARINLDATRSFNVLCKAADGTMGWPEYAHYDAIIVAAGGPEVPAALIEQLADPGVMVIPVGDRAGQCLVRVTKRGGEVKQERGEMVRFVSLIGTQGWQE
jgi:protein-L-isoaspartate(D-aspartate) O-methyltransferase